MTNKDWNGDSRSIYTCLGASNHSLTDREENDYYATDPIAIDCLIAGGAKLSHNLWECACGEGHLSKRLAKYGYAVKSTDLIERGFGGGVQTFSSVHQCLMGILSLIRHTSTRKNLLNML